MSEELKISEKISHLYQNEEYKKITGFFNEIIANSTKDLHLLNILGISLIKEESFSKALEVFEKIYEINPDHPHIKINLGNLCRLSGRFDKAIEYFNLEIQEDSESFASFYNLSLVYEEKNDSYLALKNLNKIIDKVPTQHAQLIDDIGPKYINHLINLGKNKEAYTKNQELLEKYPNSVELLAKQANLCAWEDDSETAIKYYKKALSLNENNDAIKYDLSFSLKKAGREKEVLNILKDVNYKDSRAVYIETLFSLELKDEFLKELDDACINFKGSRLLADLSTYTSYLYDSDDKYPFCNNPMDFLYTRNILDPGFVKSLIEEINNLDIDYLKQDLIHSGKQSSGNLFTFGADKINDLKSIIINELSLYKEKFINEDQYFLKFWPKETELNGWYIDLKKGGKLYYHNHQVGWISGSVYLKIPDTKDNKEGSIEFSFNNINRKFIEGLPTKIYKPSVGDIVLFPSSLNHRVNPFNSKDDKDNRISIAFDLIPR